MYPIYASIVAIRSADDNPQTHRLHGKWVTFWTVLSLVSIVERFIDILISWLPFYLECKLIGLIWLTVPQFDGAQYVFDTYIRPQFLQHEEKLDSLIDDANVKATTVATELWKETTGLVRKQSSEVLKKTHQLVIEKATQNILGVDQQQESENSRASPAWTWISESLAAVQTISTPEESSTDDSKMDICADEKASETKAVEEKAASKSEPEEPLFEEKKRSRPLSPSKMLTTMLQKAKGTFFDAKAVPKSESSVESSPKHSDSEEKDHEILFRVQELLAEGVPLRKYGSKAGPQVRLLYVVGDRVEWRAVGSDESLGGCFLQDLVMVRTGNTSSGFARAASKPPSALCFSLVKSDNTALEFETHTTETKTLLVRGFRLILAKVRFDTKQ